MSVAHVLKILKSAVIDDPEDLLVWLGTDGIEVLEEYQALKAAQPALALKVHAKLLELAFETGKSDATFDGIDTSSQLICDCKDCKKKYYEGWNTDSGDSLVAL